MVGGKVVRAMSDGDIQHVKNKMGKVRRKLAKKRGVRKKYLQYDHSACILYADCVRFIITKLIRVITEATSVGNVFLLKGI